MNRVDAIWPILPVHDMAAAMAFYRRLGLEVEAYDEGYAWVRYEGFEIWHLAAVDGLVPADNAAACYVHTPDAAAWHARLLGDGIEVSAFEATPWGKREFSLVDPSGNTVRVGTNSA